MLYFDAGLVPIPVLLISYKSFTAFPVSSKVKTFLLIVTA